MSLRLYLLTLSVAAVFLIQNGCQYNGSIPSGTSDKTKAELAQFIQEQQDHREAARLAERRRGPVDFQGAGETAGTNAPDRSAGPHPGSNPDSVTTTTPVLNPGYAPAYTGRPAVGALGLYGQVAPTHRPNASPMDGTGNLRRVTMTAEGADFDPHLDPTGKLLAYASTRHRDTADIYIKRVGAAAVTQVTNDPANDVMPAFSPDGSKIAFASDRAGNWDIYVMDAAGGKPIQITSDPTHDIHPSFSPDGTQLVYCTYGAPSGQWEMVVVDLNSPASKKYIGHGLFPSWSPNADTILFQRARQRGTRWFSIWTLDLIDGDAGAPTELAASANAACITPQWSSDGRNIVFCTVIDPTADETQRPTQADVWLMKADGDGRVRMTSGHYANLQPVWAPDGSIFFVSNRGPEGTDNIWSLRSDRAVQLAENTAAGPAPQAPTANVPTPTD